MPWMVRFVLPFFSIFFAKMSCVIAVYELNAAEVSNCQKLNSFSSKINSIIKHQATYYFCSISFDLTQLNNVLLHISI